MSQAASQLSPMVRGPSRFRLRVQRVVAGLKPYGWEIYDEEDGRTVRRSTSRFRSSAEAWHASTAVPAQSARARAGAAPHPRREFFLRVSAWLSAGGPRRRH